MLDPIMWRPSAGWASGLPIGVFARGGTSLGSECASPSADGGVGSEVFWFS